MIIGGMVLTQDITDLKYSVALRREQQRYNEMMANIPAMVLRYRVINGEFVLEYLSPRCLELNGFSAEAAMQNPRLFTDQFQPDDLLAFWERMNQAVVDNQVFTWEGRVFVNGELHWRKYEVYPTPQADGSIVWNGLQTDTTEEKVTEAALLEAERLRTVFQKEQELSTLKTRMMQRISHEFRTPLALILTATNLLQRYHARFTDKRKQEYRSQIEGQVMHLSNVLDEIDLVIDGIFEETVFETRNLDMEEVCREETNRLQTNSPLPVNIEVTVASHLPPVFGDERHIRAILSNLLSNAVKFSAGDSLIRLNVSLRDGQLIISVQDHGIGIPHEDQERLFEPFHRGSNVGEIPGLGLGLSVVNNAVHLHDGTINIHSIPDEGTTVTVSLPVRPENRAPRLIAPR